MHSSSGAMFRIAGLAACVLAGVQGFFAYWVSGRQLIPYLGADALGAPEDLVFRGLLLLVVAGILVFAAAFWQTTGRTTERPTAGIVALVAVQVAVAFVVEPHMLILVAAELPFILRHRAALAWLAGLTLLVAAVGGLQLITQEALAARIGIAVNTLSIIAWQVFAFCVGYIATAARRSRAELAGAHAELLATQQMLAESTRAAERLRIARELHDGLGHHLTALALHLDLAARQAGDRAADAIRTSHGLARQLLTELRNAVGTQREQPTIDLRRALRTLCAGIPAPRIALRYDECIEVSDPSLALVVFRSVQEAISNAIRHAAADTVQVSLSLEHGGLAVTVSDDGCGADGIEPGNGLRGMRERVEERGGRLDLRSEARGGLTVRIWLPRHEDAR